MDASRNTLSSRRIEGRIDRGTPGRIEGRTHHGTRGRIDGRIDGVKPCWTHDSAPRSGHYRSSAQDAYGGNALVSSLSVGLPGGQLGGGLNFVISADDAFNDEPKKTRVNTEMLCPSDKAMLLVLQSSGP